MNEAPGSTPSPPAARNPWSVLFERLFVTAALLLGGWLLLDAYLAPPPVAAPTQAISAAPLPVAVVSSQLTQPGQWWFQGAEWTVDFAAAASAREHWPAQGLEVAWLPLLLPTLADARVSQDGLEFWRITRGEMSAVLATRATSTGMELLGVDLKWPQPQSRQLRFRPVPVALDASDARTSGAALAAGNTLPQTATLLPFAEPTPPLIVRKLPDGQTSLEIVQSGRGAAEIHAYWQAEGWQPGHGRHVPADWAEMWDGKLEEWTRGHEVIVVLRLSADEDRSTPGVWLLWKWAA